MQLDVTTTDVPERGQKLLRDLSPSEASAHRCEFVAVDVDSGRLFFENTAVAAFDLARAQLPKARIYVGRIGARATYEIGPGSAPRNG